MKDRRSTFGLLGTALVVALAVAWGYLRPAHVRAADEGNTQTLEGKAAPDVSLDTIDGKKFKVSDLKGNVIVLDFWATWCVPCRETLPHVQKLSADKALGEKGLRVWTVNVKDDKERAQAYMKKNNYTFNTAVDKDDDAAYDAYRIEGLPTTIVIGRDGKVKKVFIGVTPDTAKELDAAVEAALAEKAGEKPAEKGK